MWTFSSQTEIKWRKFFSLFSSSSSAALRRHHRMTEKFTTYNENSCLTSITFFYCPKKFTCWMSDHRMYAIKSHSISLTATRFSKIQAHQLHHVGLEKIYIPPWNALRLCERARLGGEERWGRSVDGFLWDARAVGRDLHRRFSSCHVQNCKEKRKIVK